MERKLRLYNLFQQQVLRRAAIAQLSRTDTAHVRNRKRDLIIPWLLNTQLNSSLLFIIGIEFAEHNSIGEHEWSCYLFARVKIICADALKSGQVPVYTAYKLTPDLISWRIRKFQSFWMYFYCLERRWSRCSTFAHTRELLESPTTMCTTCFSKRMPVMNKKLDNVNGKCANRVSQHDGNDLGIHFEYNCNSRRNGS